MADVCLLEGCQELLWESILSIASFSASFLVDPIAFLYIGRHCTAGMQGGYGLGVSLGNLLVLTIGLGLVDGLDTLCPQAIGFGHPESCWAYLFQSIAIVSFIGPFLFPFVWFLEPCILHFRQSPDVAHHASRFLWTGFAGLLSECYFDAVRKFLIYHQKLSVQTAISFLAIPLRLLFLHLFVSKLSLGPSGAGIARSIGGAITLLLSVTYVILERKEMHWKEYMYGSQPQYHRNHITVTSPISFPDGYIPFLKDAPPNNNNNSLNESITVSSYEKPSNLQCHHCSSTSNPSNLPTLLHVIQQEVSEAKEYSNYPPRLNPFPLDSQPLNCKLFPVDDLCQNPSPWKANQQRKGHLMGSDTVSSGSEVLSSFIGESPQASIIKYHTPYSDDLNNSTLAAFPNLRNKPFLPPTKLSKSALPGSSFTRSNSWYKGIPLFLKFAIPSTLLLILEWASFEAQIVESSYLGTEELAAFGAFSSLLTLVFMLSLSIGVVVCSRVGQAIGSGRANDAKTYTLSGVSLGLAFSIPLSFFLFIFSTQVAYLITPLESIAELLTQNIKTWTLIIPIDSLHIVLTGSLKALGLQREGCVSDAISLLGVMQIVGVIAAFHFELKGRGLILGIGAGLIVSVTIFGYLFFHYLDWDKKLSTTPDWLTGEAGSLNSCYSKLLKESPSPEGRSSEISPVFYSPLDE